MDVTYVLGASVLLQAAAAILAFRLIRLTGLRTAWLLIATALSLMAVRRSVTLFRLISGDVARPPDLAAELVALGISVLMVAGIGAIGPLFLSIRHSNEALRESQERFRAIFESAAIGIARVDMEGRPVQSNSALQRMLGYNAEELRRMVFTEFTHPDDAGADWDLYRELVEGKRDYYQMEKRYYRKDRRLVWGRLTVSLVRDAKGEPDFAIGMVENITERKRAAEARTRLATAVEQAADIITVTDLEGTIQHVNPAFERITGYSREEAVGQNSRILKSGKHDAAFYREMWDTLARGEVWAGHIVNRKKDGNLFEAELTISPVRDASGKLVSYVGVARDVTEEVALQTRLRLAQRLEAVGRLAGGVAHDFNNMLTVIMAHSDLLLSDLAQGDPKRADIEQVRKAGERAASITRQLLAFSRKQVLQPKVLDLNVVVADMDKMLRRLIGEDVELVSVLEPTLGRVKADPSQIEQVIMNLAINARDAMPQGGKLTIETANVELDEEYVGAHAVVQPGAYVMLVLTDAGVGMDAETQAHIFEPFFTTKEKGEGTGLGLATVYGIVKQSGGFIWVYSEPGRGTTFKVYLPRVEEAAEALAKREEPGLLPRGTETVLVVEDEPAVRELAARVLREQGYTVLEAPRGEDALKMAEMHGHRIHLLLTDAVMPGMSGRELAERLQASRPGTKALYVSGYTDNAIARHGLLEPGVVLLQKPFTPRALARKVRDVLDAAPQLPA